MSQIQLKETMLEAFIGLNQIVQAKKLKET